MKTGRRFLAGVIGAMLTIAMLSGMAFAGTETATRKHSTLVQGDPCYWVKCEQERLGLCVFAGTDVEAGFRLQIAQERLDEAVELMEQSRFAEANSALEQYRVQIQLMNQAMVSIRQRAAAEAADGSGSSGGKSEDIVSTRNGWLEPDEIMERIEQRTRTQLRTLDQLCQQDREQVRDQVRLALQECTQACACDQSGQAAGQNNQGNVSGQANTGPGAAVTSEQQTREQEQNQIQEQNQGEDQKQNQEQNQTQEKQNNPATEPEQPEQAPGPQSRQGK